MDEPRRPGAGAGAGVCGVASTPTCPLAAMRHKDAAVFRRAVPPGSDAHAAWDANPGEFPVSDLQGPGNVADGEFCGGGGGDDPQAGGRGPGGGCVSAGCRGVWIRRCWRHLLHKAIGSQLACIFVDNGLLRKNERQTVEATFRDHFQIDLRVVDAAREFLTGLAGVMDPQEKRKIIGKTFIDVFKREAAAINGMARNSWPGDAVSGCDRVGPRPCGDGGEHQAAPQCGRAAGGTGV